MVDSFSRRVTTALMAWFEISLPKKNTKMLPELTTRSETFSLPRQAFGKKEKTTVWTENERGDFLPILGDVLRFRWSGWLRKLSPSHFHTHLKNNARPTWVFLTRTGPRTQERGLRKEPQGAAFLDGSLSKLLQVAFLNREIEKWRGEIFFLFFFNEESDSMLNDLLLKDICGARFDEPITAVKEEN